uniref:Uncharacterized protein n=1 Tax=Tetranychus urticae TaxID=32264 RepID=T1KZ38_TETUR
MDTGSVGGDSIRFTSTGVGCFRSYDHTMSTGHSAQLTREKLRLAHYHQGDRSNGTNLMDLELNPRMDVITSDNENINTANNGITNGTNVNINTTSDKFLTNDSMNGVIGLIGTSSTLSSSCAPKALSIMQQETSSNSGAQSSSAMEMVIFIIMSSTFNLMKNKLKLNAFQTLPITFYRRSLFHVISLDQFNQERIKDFLEEIEQSLVSAGNKHDFNSEGLNEELISSNSRSVLMSRVNRSIGQTAIQENGMKKDSDSSEVGSMESCNTYSSCFSTFHSSLLDIPSDIVNLKDCFTNKMINQQPISPLPSSSSTNITSQSNLQLQNQPTNKTDSALTTKIIAELTPQQTSLTSHSSPALAPTPPPTSTPPPHPLTLHLASLPVTPVTSPVPPAIESISSPSTSIQAELTRSNEIETNHESDTNGDGSQSNAILTTDDQAPLLAQNVYINPLYKSDPL